MRKKIPVKGFLTSVVVTMALLSPAFAHPDNDGDDHNHPGRHEPRGAPAPLLGAGLPGLAIGLGYGAYWLVRRRRNAG